MRDSAILSLSRRWPDASPVELLARLPAAERTKVLSRMSPQDAVNFPYAWRDRWARPSQLAPPGEWSTWLVLAGRFFGKTRTGARCDGAGPGRHPRDRTAEVEADLSAIGSAADLAQRH